MCGIVAYIGHQAAAPILLKGLERLEYRGYDSAGVALLEKGRIEIRKVKGRVADLKALMAQETWTAQLGIDHTRWATHGEPNQTNAHPHVNEDGSLVVVHNGIIENHAALKEELERRGHQFYSETDTEVLVHLIEEIQHQKRCSLAEAVRLALTEVVGAYAIVVFSSDEPETLVGARKGSPLVIGIGKNEYYFASDATPIVEYTKRVIYLDDGEVASIENGRLEIKTLDNQVQDPVIEELTISLEAIEKGGFEHFMLKEIYEQPEAILRAIRGRVRPAQNRVKLSGVWIYKDEIPHLQRLITVGCGTSWHAGLVGEYLIEDMARLPVEVEYGSEFRYRNPIIYSNDLVVAISQSGETADTLAAVKLAKEKGARVLGICNVVGSSIAREAHSGIYTHAGPEIGVASTKAFTTQLAALTMMGILMGQLRRQLTDEAVHQLLTELYRIPDKIRDILKLDNMIREIAGKYAHANNFLYLGRGYNFPVALEGALKLKEISYIHAEGYPAAEMKHGPIALIDENMPVVVIATNHKQFDKIVSNVQEVKSRGGKIISVVTENGRELRSLSDDYIEIPSTLDPLSPLLSIIPLQLLAYHIAVLRGCDVDKPRNLAKSVTVE